MSGGGGGIDLPQLPLLPPPSSLGGGGGAPFVLPDFSPCPQVSIRAVNEPSRSFTRPSPILHHVGLLC